MVEYCVGSFVPIIVALFYLGDEFGYSEDVIKHINELRKFYDYREVVGVSDGAPVINGLRYGRRSEAV